MVEKRCPSFWSASLLIFLTLTVLSSCSTRLSVEKRHFRPGYHVEVSKPNGRPIARLNESTPRYISRDVIHAAASVQQQDSDLVKPLEVTTHLPFTEVDVNMEMAVSPREDVSILSIPPTTMRLYGRSNALQANKEWIRETQRGNALSIPPATEVQGNQGLKIAGIVLTSIGFLLLLFISWLIGLIIMLLGLGLLIAGLNKPSNDNGSNSQRTNEPTWQDVLYLKNGSVIKGVIIEQVPNESLKIQTADGSIFVYEMDQVAKIAKEQK